MNMVEATIGSNMKIIQVETLATSPEAWVYFTSTPAGPHRPPGAMRGWRASLLVRGESQLAFNA